MFVKCSSPDTSHLTNSSSQAAFTPLPISQRDHNSQHPIINVLVMMWYHSLRELFTHRHWAQEMENNLPVSTEQIKLFWFCSQKFGVKKIFCHWDNTTKTLKQSCIRINHSVKIFPSKYFDHQHYRRRHDQNQNNQIKSGSGGKVEVDTWWHMSRGPTPSSTKYWTLWNVIFPQV